MVYTHRGFSGNIGDRLSQASKEYFKSKTNDMLNEMFPMFKNAWFEKETQDIKEKEQSDVSTTEHAKEELKGTQTTGSSSYESNGTTYITPNPNKNLFNDSVGTVYNNGSSTLNNNSLNSGGELPSLDTGNIETKLEEISETVKKSNVILVEISQKLELLRGIGGGLGGSDAPGGGGGGGLGGLLGGAEAGAAGAAGAEAAIPLIIGGLIAGIAGGGVAYLNNKNATDGIKTMMNKFKIPQQGEELFKEDKFKPIFNDVYGKDSVESAQNAHIIDNIQNDVSGVDALKSNMKKVYDEKRKAEEDKIKTEEESIGRLELTLKTSSNLKPSQKDYINNKIEEKRKSIKSSQSQIDTLNSEEETKSKEVDKRLETLPPESDVSSVPHGMTRLQLSSLLRKVNLGYYANQLEDKKITMSVAYAKYLERIGSNPEQKEKDGSKLGDDNSLPTSIPEDKNIAGNESSLTGGLLSGLLGNIPGLGNVFSSMMGGKTQGPSQEVPGNSVLDTLKGKLGDIGSAIGEKTGWYGGHSKTSSKPSIFRRSKHSTESEEKPELTAEEKEAYKAVGDTPISTDDGKVKVFDKFSRDQLKSGGIERYTDPKDGKEYYKKSSISEDEIKSRATGEGKSQESKNQKIAYDTFKSLGYTDKEAKLNVANISGEALYVPGKGPQGIADTHPDGSSSNPNQMAHGIASWDDARSARIAGKFGASPEKLSLPDQIKAYDWELKTHYPDTYAALKDESLSDSERMYKLVKGFENPGDSVSAAENRLKKIPSIDKALSIPSDGKISPEERDRVTKEIESERQSTLASAMHPKGSKTDSNKALLAVGTNDWGSEEAAYQGTLASIKAAKEKGLDPTIVLPRKDMVASGQNSPTSAAYDGALKAAQEMKVKSINPEDYIPKDADKSSAWGKGSDNYHISPETAKAIRAANPNISDDRIMGDSNAGRLGGTYHYDGKGGKIVAEQIGSNVPKYEEKTLDASIIPKPSLTGDDYSGIRLTSGSKATQGGDAQLGTINAAKLFQQKDSNLVSFNAFNDEYHSHPGPFHSGPDGAHGQGLAFDARTKDIESTKTSIREQMKTSGIDEVPWELKNTPEGKKGYSLEPGDGGGTGAHVHFQFNSPDAAKSFNDFYTQQYEKMAKAGIEAVSSKPEIELSNQDKLYENMKGRGTRKEEDSPKSSLNTNFWLGKKDQEPDLASDFITSGDYQKIQHDNPLTSHLTQATHDDIISNSFKTQPMTAPIIHQPEHPHTPTPKPTHEKKLERKPVAPPDERLKQLFTTSTGRAQGPV